ncbi:MAG: hypothetical protein ACJATT_003452 [Myxococcota bacterium]|jgi:hypothetical protein
MADFSATSGRESASATEMPPLRPPQARIGIVPRAKVLNRPRSSTGALTAARCATSANGTATAINQAKSVSKRSTSTSSPINRNRTEFSISSFNVQKPER